MRRIGAALVPEHLGDISLIALVAAFGMGLMLFWFLAWVPVSEPLSEWHQEQIPFFSDGELNALIETLDARTEASTAPVVPPARDPFR